MEYAAEALKEIGSPLAEKYAIEAAKYRKDILDSMEAAAFEYQGQMLLPMEPETHRLLKLEKNRSGGYYGLTLSPLLATASVFFQLQETVRLWFHGQQHLALIFKSR